MVVLSDVADDTTAELLAEVARLRAERAARSAASPPPPHRPLPPLSDSIREADDDTDEDNDGDGDDSGSDVDGRPVDGRRFYKAEAAASTPVRTTLNYTNGDTYKARSNAARSERAARGAVMGGLRRRKAEGRVLASAAYTHPCPSDAARTGQGEALPNGKRHGTGRHVCSTGDSYGARRVKGLAPTQQQQQHAAAHAAAARAAPHTAPRLLGGRAPPLRQRRLRSTRACLTPSARPALLQRALGGTTCATAAAAPPSPPA